MILSLLDDALVDEDVVLVNAALDGLMSIPMRDGLMDLINTVSKIEDGCQPTAWDEAYAALIYVRFGTRVPVC